MTLAQAVNKMRIAGAKWRPPVGIVLEIPTDHYFFLNSDVPAVRIRRCPASPGWETVHPDDQTGLVVFITDRLKDRPARIALTEVRASVALAKEQTSA